MVGEPVFREEQRLRQVWVWLLSLAIAALAWWAFLDQIVRGRPWGDRPAPDWAVWLIWIVFGLGLPAFLRLARMIVVVTADEVDIRWIPIWRRRVPIDSIVSARPRRYRPILEFGGWGVRWGGRGRMAYNVSGNEGVELVLTERRKVLIGSRRAEELAAAIEPLLSPTPDEVGEVGRVAEEE